MLYESLSQPLIILCLFAIGIAAGMVFDVAKFVIYLFNNHKFARQAILFTATIIACALFFIVNLKVNLGRLRLYPVVIFAFSVALEQSTVGILWTKLLKKCYNQLSRIKSWIAGKLDGRKKQEKQN